MPPVLLPRLDTTLYAELQRASHQVLLVSPFLTMPVAQQLKAIKRASPADWSLLTRLDPRSVASGVLSTQGLTDLLEVGVRLYDLAALHAKAFIADDLLGVVGSANLTRPGLGSAGRPNVELSVRLDTDEIPGLRATIRDWMGAGRPATVQDVRRVEEQARLLPRPVSGSLGDLQPSPPAADALPVVPPGVTLWTKAQYGAPDWQQWRSPYWFSSRGDRRPGFHPGDLALIYAQESHTCYAVVEVTDEPTFDPDFVNAHRDGGQRWPWVNRTRPFLVPEDGRTVSPLELGFDGRSLQNGNKKLDLTTFLTALEALGASPPLAE